ncbi:MAG TPA: glycosyltransferase, partial [Chroococcales cyanobacterium]
MRRERKQRRVLEVIASGAIGGGASHLRSLLGGLDRSFFQPTVVCSPDGPLLSELSHFGVASEGLALGGRFNFTALPKLMGIARRNGIEVIHAHGTRAGLVSAL